MYSQMLGQLDISSQTYRTEMYPSRAIWWPRVVLHQVILTFGYPLCQADLSFSPEHFWFLMRKFVLCKQYHGVIICQIDGVSICINWHGENIVHITFLYIVCKNMWLGGIDINVQTVIKCSPKLYNSLQSSFLSLAWTWSGRSLPKGNQWDWWDPGQGPLSGHGEVGHSLRGTSGSAGTLDWSPMWLGSQSTCHL